MSKTLSIIKPDALNNYAEIAEMIENDNMEIGVIVKTCSNKNFIEELYAEHKNRVFFDDLVEYMTSGPIIIQTLTGDDVVTKYRKLMGSTDSTQAEKGTIREAYGTDKTFNAVHGSEPGAELREIDLFTSHLRSLSGEVEFHSNECYDFC